MVQYRVYADFNCPFCFALDQRLKRCAGAFDIEWRPIEHAPAVSAATCDVFEQAELASEVFTVRHRAPGLGIRLPRSRPNTALANTTYASVSAAQPERAEDLKTALYEALWIHGQDLSDPAIVSGILSKLGLSLGDAGQGDRLARWQNEWEQGPYDRRIPTIAATDGRTLLGLSAPRQIEDFLAGRSGTVHATGVCEFVPRQILLVVGDPAPAWPLIERFTGQCDVRVAVDTDDAITQLRSREAEVVLLVGPAARPSSRLAEAAARASTALLVIDSQPSGESAHAALEAGASDWIEASAPPALFEARLRVHLEARRQLDLLHRQVSLDSLTQVPGRREFERLMELEWQRGSRSKLPLSVLVIDVDAFGAFNESYGHDRGDACLREIAMALSQVPQRASDALCRQGGEEFAAILPNTTEQAAAQLAQNCLRAVEALAIPHADSPRGQVTVSVGHATVVPTEDGDLHRLLRGADEAMYQAKAKGRAQAVAGRVAEPNSG